MLARVLVLVLVTTIATAATAQRMPTLSGPDCDCTDGAGRAVPQGQATCIVVPGRSYRAVCSMSQNAPAWRDTGEPCVTG